MCNRYIKHYQQIGRGIAFYRNKRNLSQEELGYMIKRDISFVVSIEELGVNGFCMNKTPWSDETSSVFTASK